MKVRRISGLVVGSFWVMALGIAGAEAQSNGVNIGGNNTVINLEGQGREFILGGNHDEVHIRGECKSIQVVGNQNTVHLERVDEIKVTGAQNKIFYQSGLAKSSPAISQFGMQNRVTKVEGLGSSATRTQVQSGNGGSVAGQVVLTGDGSNFTRSVYAQQVRLQGDRNQITLTGSADELFVTGKNNSVAIEKVGKVRFLGDNNTVSYRNTPDGRKPEVASLGDNNSVRQADH
jgi:hypothetical protein